jgi:hypothetical protein
LDPISNGTLACLPARKHWIGCSGTHHPSRITEYRSRAVCAAVQVYTQREKPNWTRRERQKIFAWIGARATRILSAMENPNHCHLRRAWRRSAEAWLRCQGLIEVSINQKPVTPFCPIPLSEIDLPYRLIALI